MSYVIMLIVAAILALFSSIMTAFGMTDLFKAAGMFILILFVIIDLGRFLLFNFVVNEWHNLRKIKYIIVIILILLFGYSAVGVYSKLDSLVTQETKQAMVNAAIYNKANQNANVKQNRSEDLAKIAQEEYKNAMEWNKNDHVNCLARANNDKNAENRCNNTKRALDNKASVALKTALAEADKALDNVEEKVKLTTENKNEIANVLTTICKLSQKSCDTYDNLQNALTIVIFLVIIGTDYLQIAIVLAVNTRKNKKIKNDDVEILENSTKKKLKKQQPIKSKKLEKQKLIEDNKEFYPSSEITPVTKTYQENDLKNEQDSETNKESQKILKNNQPPEKQEEQHILQEIKTEEQTHPFENLSQKVEIKQDPITLMKELKRPFRFTGPKPQK